MKLSRWCALVTTAFFACAAAHAQRVVEARDGAVVRVSASEPNLIEAAHGRITAFVFTEGKFSETADPEVGVVYFRPLEEGPRSGFVEVEGNDGERRRFSLILVPSQDWPAQRIVLKSRQTPAVAPATAPQEHVPQSEPHVAAVKRIMRLMLKGAAGLRETQPAKLVLDELVLTKLADYHEGGLVGELHRVDNASDKASYLAEARLHLDDDVMAVMVPLTGALEPGGSAEVYLVRSAAKQGAL